MWKPNDIEIERYEIPSLRDAYKQVGRGVERLMEWSYENNKGLRTFVGTGLVLGGILGMTSAGMVVEPQRARDLGIVLSAMVEVAGLSLLFSAIGDYREEGRERRTLA
jgi:hypothetical protein